MSVTICHRLYSEVLEQTTKQNLQDFDLLQFVNMKMAFASEIGLAELWKAHFFNIAIESPRQQYRGGA